LLRSSARTQQIIVKRFINHSQEYKKYRDKIGVSQDKLSKLAGVVLHTLTKIKAGATPNTTILLKKSRTHLIFRLMF